MLRILFVNTLYKPHIQGGAEISTQQLAEYFNAKEEYEVAVLSTANKDNEKISSVNGVTNYRLYVPHFFWRYKSSEQSIAKKILWRFGDLYNPLAKSSLEKVYRKFSPDLVHTNNIAGFSVYIWEFLKSKNVPIVHTLRDYYMMCNYSSMYRTDPCESQCLNCQVLNYHKTFYSNLVDSVVGVSHHILNKHINHNYFDKLNSKAVIGNSVQSRPASVLNVNTSRDLVFGYLGTVTPLKGVELLLEAFKRLNNSNKKLLIAGSEFRPGYIEELKRRFNNKIQFLGYTDRTDFFKKIDILVHPALWNEPFGRIVIEAFSFGRPVITSSKGGLSEINHQGKTGHVLEELNVECLTRVMESYIAEPKKLKQQSLEAIKIASNYTTNKIGGEYEIIYKESLNASN